MIGSSDHLVIRRVNRIARIHVKYYSGEEIRKGDKVLIMDTEGEIEFIVEEPIGEPAMDWYLEE